MTTVYLGRAVIDCHRPRLLTIIPQPGNGPTSRQDQHDFSWHVWPWINVTSMKAEGDDAKQFTLKLRRIKGHPTVSVSSEF